MIARPDLLGTDSPGELEVFQLTDDPKIPSCHVYMEAQIFTSDSKYFLLRSNTCAHGYAGNVKLLLCEIESGQIIPVTDEESVSGPAVSPDGRFFYYFTTTLVRGRNRVSLCRRKLDGSEKETISVLDGHVPGTACSPSRVYPLSTLSSDGARLATSCFLGDGTHRGAPWALLVFDLATGECHVPLLGPSWCNIHPQYSRSKDPESIHDIMVQENHGNICTPDGCTERLVDEVLGCDIHVIRDDGQNFRNLPWGRDVGEHCMGHQCWRGRTRWAISAQILDGEVHLYEGTPAPHRDHEGRHSPEGRRNRLCRNFPNPQFYHFATDIEGTRFLTDYFYQGQDALYLMRLGEVGAGAFEETIFLLRPRSSWKKEAHVHPFLSPDGRAAFFNSDESGQLQAYMIRNLPGGPRAQKSQDDAAKGGLGVSHSIDR